MITHLVLLVTIQQITRSNSKSADKEDQEEGLEDLQVEFLKTDSHPLPCFNKLRQCPTIATTFLSRMSALEGQLIVWIATECKNNNPKE
jgi:hypothetical protein